MKWSKLTILNRFIESNVDFYLKKTVLRNVKVDNIRWILMLGEVKEILYERDGKQGYLRADEIVNFEETKT